MLTLEDCIALSGLTPEEAEVIAEGQHLPDIIAVELGAYLVRTRAGQARIKAIMRDHIAEAQARDDHRRAAQLKLCLKQFIAQHAG